MKTYFKRPITVFVFFLVSQTCGAAPVILSLDGDTWTVKNDNGSIKVGARVPGSIYTDLERGDVIKSPYYRFNDVEYRWVSHDNWTYSRTFEVSTEMLQNTAMHLTFEGLDTVAKVSVNGHMVGEANNMFRRYTFNIKADLKEGANTLEVAFQSPVLYAAAQAKSYPYDVPPDCPSPQQKGECNFNFIRKEASSFSWDWGPAFPTMGIWKPLFLEAFTAPTIRTLSVGTHKGDQTWSLNGTVFFNRDKATEVVKGQLVVDIWNLTNFTLDVTLQADQLEYPFQVDIEKHVELWWPNGHGKQHLYDVLVTFEDSSKLGRSETFLRVGFRTVELVQEPIPSSSGLSFYFKINGVPIFMKGSNWIPADSFQERITESYLERLLLSTAEANMNMLRVWGGGVYESEEFYNLADGLGIMLWHDFMYACAMYPTNDEFLDNVQAEIHHQVHRIRHHPSVAIWAGNNENEGGVDQFRSKPTWKRYYDDYVKLYISTIKEIVEHLDVDRPFVPSSPSNGVETEKEGWVAKDPYDEHYGDVHFYDYRSDGWNWRSFPVPRFASEFGFESWCSPNTLVPVSEVETDWGMDTDFVNHRQHHPGGNQQMFDEFSMHLKPPTNQNKTLAFIDYIYLTQINQAVSIKTEAELYRRSQSEVNSDGKGMTMGSLYWQLNDIWQGPTWASIEYGGTWKMLHNYARKFYNTTIMSPYLDNGAVKLYYIEDPVASTVRPHHTPVVQTLDGHIQSPGGVVNMEVPGTHQGEEILIYICVFHWDSLKPTFTQWYPAQKPSKAAGLVYQRELTDLLSKANCASPDDCFIEFSLTTGNAGPTNILLLSNFTTTQGLSKPNLKVTSINQVEPKVIELTLTTDVPTPFVWLEVLGELGEHAGRFSDNGFIMTEERRTVVYFSWEPVHDMERFKEMLVVKSLMDVYE